MALIQRILSTDTPSAYPTRQDELADAAEAALMSRGTVATYLRCLGRLPTATQTFVNERTYYSHIIVPSSAWSFDAITWFVSAVGDATAVVRFGMWAVNDDGSVGTLIIDAGTVSASTTGDKTAVFGAAVTPGSGLYVLGATVQASPSVAPGGYWQEPWPQAYGHATTGTLYRGRPLTSSPIAGAYASNPTTTSDAVNGGVPAMGLRRSA